MSFSNQVEEEEPVFSPRNIIKFFSKSVQEFKRDHSTATKYAPSQIEKEFFHYVQSITKEYSKYKRNHQKVIDNNQQQELEAQIKISRIPNKYFKSTLPVEKFKNKREATRNQEELQQFLDEIELVIFNKTSKYPSETFLYINNITSAENQIQKAMAKVKAIRLIMNNKLKAAVQKQKTIKKYQRRRQKISTVLGLAKSLQKLYALKCFAESDCIDKDRLLSLDRKQINNLKHINIKAIKNIVYEFEDCEHKIAQNSFKMLREEFLNLIHLCLQYNKEQWIKSEIPDNAFNYQHQLVQSEHTETQANTSFMNISILDQSYFSIESNQSINPANLLTTWECLTTVKITPQHQQQLGQLLMRQLVKNSVVFSKDFEEYVAYIFKMKNIHLKQSMETLKKTKHEDRVQILSIKFFLKIVRVYYGCLKNIIELIRKVKHKIVFLQTVETKALDFIKQRVEHFLSLRKINQHHGIEEIAQLMNIIDYWLVEDYLQQELLNIRYKLLEEYVLAIHKNILVNELKKAIEQSDYKVISITSEYFMVFDFILSWDQRQETTMSNNVLETSMSLYGQKPLNSIYRIIDKTIIIEGKSYKLCDSFLRLMIVMERYLQIKVMFNELEKNIDEKICEVVGFYLWYNKKLLLNQTDKSIRSVCLFVSVCELMEKIMSILTINTVPKKVTKTTADILNIKEDLRKQIIAIPLTTVEAQISKLYQSRLKTRKEVPTSQTMKIISIVEMAKEQIRSHFNIEDTKKYLEPTLKLISKNYFGYLLNLEQRGKAQLRWFMSEFKDTLIDVFPLEVKQLERQLGGR